MAKTTCGRPSRDEETDQHGDISDGALNGCLVVIALTLLFVFMLCLWAHGCKWAPVRP